MDAATTEIKVFNAAGTEVKTVSVSAEIFEADLRVDLLHEIVRWQRAKRRAGTHSTKTRAQMSGGGVKPWKQKGTGRARAGSNTSPLWVGGGVAHGPKPRSYEFSVNRKQRRLALCSALSSRREEGRLFVLESFGLGEIKTKAAAAVLGSLGVPTGEATLVVVNNDDVNVMKSLRNIEGVRIVRPRGLNVYDVLSSKYLLFTGDALEAVQGRLEA